MRSLLTLYETHPLFIKNQFDNYIICVYNFLTCVEKVGKLNQIDPTIKLLNELVSSRKYMASKNAERIINIKDGLILSDSKKHTRRVIHHDK